LALMIAAILASGPQIEFLRPSIFQEVVMWAGAAAAAFVYLLLRGLTREGGFSPAGLSGLAVAAGLCLSGRGSAALGLYVAFGLVWLRLAWSRLRGDEGAAAMGGLAVAAAVALLFAAIAGIVNFARWGNPLTFVDLSGGLIYAQYPEQL